MLSKTRAHADPILILYLLRDRYFLTPEIGIQVPGGMDKLLFLDIIVFSAGDPRIDPVVRCDKTVDSEDVQARRTVYDDILIALSS